MCFVASKQDEQIESNWHSQTTVIVVNKNTKFEIFFFHENSFRTNLKYINAGVKIQVNFVYDLAKTTLMALSWHSGLLVSVRLSDTEPSISQAFYLSHAKFTPAVKLDHLKQSKNSLLSGRNVVVQLQPWDHSWRWYGSRMKWWWFPLVRTTACQFYSRSKCRSLVSQSTVGEPWGSLRCYQFCAHRA